MAGPQLTASSLFIYGLVFLSVTALSSASKTCPDSSSCSSEDSTCCKVRSGKYNCCPLENAVCCSDGYYCCPEGSTCNVKEGTCDGSMAYMTKNNDSSESLQKSNSLSFKLSDEWKTSQSCPDKHRCADSETCCKQEEGGFGCCPYKAGICCEDNVHCCPHGSECDIEGGRCVRGMIKVKISRSRRVRKVAPLNLIAYNANTIMAVNVTSVVCPGGGSQCPDSNTCCKLKDGEWGCCPLPDALCCKDQVHCCPQNYSCVDSGCKKN